MNLVKINDFLFSFGASAKEQCAVHLFHVFVFWFLYCVPIVSYRLWWLAEILHIQAFGLSCYNLLQRTVLARYVAGLKTLMFADNLSPLLSANAAICPVLIILLSSRVHTRTDTNSHPHKPVNIHGVTFNLLKMSWFCLKVANKQDHRLEIRVSAVQLKSIRLGKSLTVVITNDQSCKRSI